MDRRLVLAFLLLVPAVRAQPPLRVGFAEADITPALGGRPVFLAGFGHNRLATSVHDPLRVRAVVLEHDGRKIAFASADVVGIFLPNVERVRSKLAGFEFVLLSATHNHHGPDTMGLWGPHPLKSGVDAEYMTLLESRLVDAVRSADDGLRPTEALIGSAVGPELLHDSRAPQVKHDELVTIRFRDPGTRVDLGAVVQWNCHPETIDSKSTRLSSDFVGPACDELKRRWRCPVVYLTGTVGGLMTSMRVRVTDEAGAVLPEGSLEKTRRYGHLVADLAQRARNEERAVRLTPFDVRSRSVLLPVDNKLYRLGRQVGVFDRAMESWAGDPEAPPGPPLTKVEGRPAVRTEISRLRLGELDVAVVPGEIYPELVLGKVQDPPEPNADFPDAPAEPAVYAQMNAKHMMIVGLGNDALGYIIPKRQWDEKPPHGFGLSKAPYGEINSLGPQTAPLLCEAFRRLCQPAVTPPRSPLAGPSAPVQSPGTGMRNRAPRLAAAPRVDRS